MRLKRDPRWLSSAIKSMKFTSQTLFGLQILQMWPASNVIKIPYIIKFPDAWFLGESMHGYGSYNFCNFILGSILEFKYELLCYLLWKRIRAKCEIFVLCLFRNQIIIIFFIPISHNSDYDIKFWHFFRSLSRNFKSDGKKKIQKSLTFVIMQIAKIYQISVTDRKGSRL